jgi:hypothetical protein
VSSNVFSFIGAWYVLGALLMGSVPLVALATALAGNPVVSFLLATTLRWNNSPCSFNFMLKPSLRRASHFFREV